MQTVLPLTGSNQLKVETDCFQVDLCGNWTATELREDSFLSSGPAFPPDNLHPPLACSQRPTPHLFTVYGTLAAFLPRDAVRPAPLLITIMAAAFFCPLVTTQ